MLALSSSAATAAPASDTTAAPQAPSYTGDGRLQLPADYRQWVFLTSGLDMSYREDGGAPDHSMFDNVFVDPEAYRTFVQTGHWPDRTALVMEVRGAQTKGSINRRGSFQSGAPMGYEVHVRDDAHGGWAFYSFNGDRAPAQKIPTDRACYTCHQAHGAVDTTFVQFYPTLLPIAEARKTLSPAFRAESGAAH
ncbi:cytochrome P460 family protein [Solimonas sp. C16B3]|uniref:Cytochrome P460 family protein n=2 Tax=Solimonas marina TaxID=2714601 RepID=A0A969W8W1_9GAMM|nr:cytochrome P460 family protein [Solimonas marina]